MFSHVDICKYKLAYANQHSHIGKNLDIYIASSICHSTDNPFALLNQHDETVAITLPSELQKLHISVYEYEKNRQAKMLIMNIKSTAQ